jgi:hypothetical protein
MDAQLDWLVWLGAALAAFGAALLLRLVALARRVRRETLSAEEVQARFARLIALNFAAVGLGFFGAALLLLGLML